jgi:hypothetical protein
MREERTVAHSGITEEAVNPSEEPGKPLGIQPGCQIAFSQAIPERVVGLPLG